MLGLPFRGVSVLALCGLLGACATDTTYSNDAAAPDAGAVPAAQLRIVGDPAITLTFGEEATLTVRYLEMDGSPVRDERVSFHLVGRANDSSLGALGAQTDASGEARGTVLAGRTPGAFRVRASAERASPVHFDVSVGDAGFGSITVEVERGESVRTIESVHAALFTGATCDDPTLVDGDPDRSTVVSDGEAVSFSTLPAGLSYAVVGRGFGRTSELVAFGCQDGLLVEADEDVAARVVLEDLPLDVEGDYSGTVEWTSADSAVLIGDTVRVATASLTSSADEDASMLLDRLEGVVRASDPMAASAIAGLRASGDLQTSLASHLDSRRVGPSVAAAELADELAGRTMVVSLDGDLLVQRRSGLQMTWLTRVFRTRGGPDTTPLVIDPSVLGYDPLVVITGRQLLDEDALDVRRLEADVTLADVANGALAALVAESGASDVAAHLERSGGCAAFASWVRAQPSVAPSCNAACASGACRSALNDVATAVGDSLASLSEARSRVQMAGRADLAADDGSITVDTLVAGDLRGEWRSADGTMRAAVSGTLSAARKID